MRVTDDERVKNTLCQFLLDTAILQLRIQGFLCYANIWEFHILAFSFVFSLQDTGAFIIITFAAVEYMVGHHRLLSEALSYGVRMDLVARNSALVVKPPKAENKETQVLDWHGVKQLLEAARETPYYHLFHLAVHTGLRRSEILGLRWKDVDVYMATLSVTQMMHRLPVWTDSV